MIVNKNSNTELIKKLTNDSNSYFAKKDYCLPEEAFRHLTSDYIVNDDTIRNLEVQSHYFDEDTNRHFYSFDRDENGSYGFIIEPPFDITYVEFYIGELLLYKCDENTIAPRTMGDVFKEWGGISL